MRSRRIGIVLLHGLFVLFATSSSATEWGHDREGFTLGFSLGGGSASFDPDGDAASVDNEGGVAVGLRLGYAINQNWVLHLDGHAWSRSEDGATTTLSVGGIGVSWFPQGQGFYLRATLGSSQGKVELDLGPVDVSSSIDGTGGSLTVGHEWRLTQTFALGPELTWSRAGFDGLDVNWVSAAAALNWYF